MAEKGLAGSIKKAPIEKVYELSNVKLVSALAVQRCVPLQPLTAAKLTAPAAGHSASAGCSLAEC